MKLDSKSLTGLDSSLSPDNTRVVVRVGVRRQDTLTVPLGSVVFFFTRLALLELPFGFFGEHHIVVLYFVVVCLLCLLSVFKAFEIFLAWHKSVTREKRGLLIFLQLILVHFLRQRLSEILVQLSEPHLLTLDQVIDGLVKHFLSNLVFCADFFFH